MKIILNILILCTVILIISCGEDNKKPTDAANGKEPIENTQELEPASKRITLENKGVGPITKIDIPVEIDQEMAAQGKLTYEKMCTACHKPDQKHIGPAPKGIMDRRAPEWIMNMILVPEKMVQEDPLAKELLMEFNGSPMANQNLTQEEARAVLEYFRTL